MSVDLRTRQDGPRSSVDAAEFFGVELPSLLEAADDALVPAVRWLAPRPLTIEVDGSRFTLASDDGCVRVSPRALDGAAHVLISAEQLDGLVHDQETFMGMWSSGRLEQPVGSLGTALHWWLVLRAALDGTPIHTPGAIDFRDEDGGPLDLARSFTTDDDPAAMRHFLEQAGFLHIAGVYDSHEMAAVSDDMDRAAPTYSDGDGRSWWATTSDGERRVVRMQSFDRHSETTTAILDDDRYLRIGEITADGHVAGRLSESRIEALFKPIGVVAGISDVPWHKDCSLGRHSYECCRLTVGISVTGADETSGQLKVRAGSHRALVWPALEQPGCDLPVVDLPTQTGDVTVHLSCTLHMAQPPVANERRVMYTGFGLPELDAAAAAGARAHLREVREAAPLTVSQTPAV
jgi:hypothetical protein